MAGREGGSRLAPFTLSAILHAAIATLLFSTLKERRPVALPPMYRVEIVAAPPGERAIGEVSPSQAVIVSFVVLILTLLFRPTGLFVPTPKRTATSSSIGLVSASSWRC